VLNKKTVQWKRISYSFVSVLLVAALLLPCGVAAVGLELELPEDVSPEDSFYRSVRSGLRFGIIVGTSEDRFIFEPNRIVTRAEFITMLGRMHEYGNEIIGTPSQGLFYERYLNWAVERGIIHGNENGDLMPHILISREQMAVVVDRYIQVFELQEYFSSFVRPPVWFDHWSYHLNETSYWAKQSMSNIFHFGIMPGGVYEFGPREYVSRADAVSSVVRIGNVVYG
jgi:hypothetical protein